MASQALRQAKQPERPPCHGDACLSPLDERTSPTSLRISNSGTRRTWKAGAPGRKFRSDVQQFPYPIGTGGRSTDGGAFLSATFAIRKDPRAFDESRIDGSGARTGL